MPGHTNPSNIRRSNERTSREGRSYEDRRQIVCYKCNNLGHITQNFHAPNDQQNPRSRALVCQLCKNFGHIEKYWIMEKNSRDGKNNGRKFENRRNYGKNVTNDKRNHERNSRTNRDNEEQRKIVSELR